MKLDPEVLARALNNAATNLALALHKMANEATVEEGLRDIMEVAEFIGSLSETVDDSIPQPH